jgi:hypothetical protein
MKKLFLNPMKKRDLRIKDFPGNKLVWVHKQIESFFFGRVLQKLINEAKKSCS